MCRGAQNAGPERTVPRQTWIGRAALRSQLELRPVPRLELESERVAAAVRHREAERRGVGREPGERFRALELGGQGPRARRREVDGAAGMVLTESRCRIHAQDGLDVLARCELLAEQIRLLTDAAKARRPAATPRRRVLRCASSGATSARSGARAAAACRRYSAPRPRDPSRRSTRRAADHGRSRQVYRGRRTAPCRSSSHPLVMCRPRSLLRRRGLRRGRRGRCRRRCRVDRRFTRG